MSSSTKRQISDTLSDNSEDAGAASVLSKKWVRDEIRPFDGAISLLIGAAVSAALLGALGFGAREVWSDFGANNTQVGSNVFRGLAISGMAGGLAAAAAYHAVVKREGKTSPALRLLSPAACALGWALLGLWFHAGNVHFLDFLAAGDRRYANAIFLNNGAWQAISVALGLLLSTIMGWIIERRFFGSKTMVASGVASDKKLKPTARETTSSTRTDAEETKEPHQALPAFGSNLSLPLLVAIPGFILLCVWGLAIHLWNPQPSPAELPAPIARAILSAIICVLSFGIASFGVRRAFGGNGRENSLAYVLSAPVVIAFVCALFFQARGEMPIINAAVNTIWNSSPFEAASWGAFGSAIGFWLAGRRQKPQLNNN